MITVTVMFIITKVITATATNLIPAKSSSNSSNSCSSSIGNNSCNNTFTRIIVITILS